LLPVTAAPLAIIRVLVRVAFASSRAIVVKEQRSI
jgi:hypothetical protein